MPLRAGEVGGEQNQRRQVDAQGTSSCDDGLRKAVQQWQSGHGCGVRRLPDHKANPHAAAQARRRRRRGAAREVRAPRGGHTSRGDAAAAAAITRMDCAAGNRRRRWGRRENAPGHQGVVVVRRHGCETPGRAGVPAGWRSRSGGGRAAPLLAHTPEPGRGARRPRASCVIALPEPLPTAASAPTQRAASRPVGWGTA